VYKKHQGTIGVTRTAHIYQMLGYNVSLPLGDLQKYDLVVERNGKFERVQVKTTTEKNGIIYMDLRTVSHNLKGLSIYKPTVKDFDIAAVVEMKTQNVYAVPFDGRLRQITLRTKSARNSQQKNIRLASKYLLNKE